MLQFSFNLKICFEYLDTKLLSVTRTGKFKKIRKVFKSFKTCISTDPSAFKENEKKPFL